MKTELAPPSILVLGWAIVSACETTDISIYSSAHYRCSVSISSLSISSTLFYVGFPRVCVSKRTSSHSLSLGSQEKATFADAIRDTPATLVEAIICFFSIWSVVGLWGYHTYLICRSVTTNEDVRCTTYEWPLHCSSLVDQRDMEYLSSW